MTPAGRAEAWRIAALLVAVVTIGVGLGGLMVDGWPAWPAVVGSLVLVAMGEIWRYQIKLKWDEIERRRREDRS